MSPENLIYSIGHNPNHYDLDEFEKGMMAEQKTWKDSGMSQEDFARVVCKHLNEARRYYTLLEERMRSVGVVDSQEKVESLKSPEKVDVNAKLPLNKVAY